MIRNFISIIICISGFSGCLFTENKDNSTFKNIINNIDGAPVIPREANKINIPIFSNLTKVFPLSEKLTIKIKEELNKDNRLIVIPDNIQADLDIEGTILDYQIQPVKYGNNDEPLIKRLRIIVAVKLIDLNKKKEIFNDKNIQAFEEFSDLIPPIYTELQIQDKVLDDLAKRISMKITDGWYTELLTPIEKGK